jgi:GxxExxY protein
MRCAFDAQNTLGRLCEERVYENDLARRLRAAGFSTVETQVPVTVSLGNFWKTYRLDLIANDAVYEIKAASALTGEHVAQALHYAMLLSINHVKLLNFRSSQVQGRLLHNAITVDVRLQTRLHDPNWLAVTPACAELKDSLLECYRNWGGFLDYRLYEEALIHNFGGDERVKYRIDITRDGMNLGSHCFCCHAPRACFLVSGFADPASQVRHIEQLFKLTDLQVLQSINLHRDILTLQTFTK